MRGKFLLIYGKSCTGKDTIMKELLNNSLFKRLVSSTTRPKRPGEKDGVDYYFVDDLKPEDTIAYKEYKVENNEIWKYGIEKGKMLDRISHNQINVMILTEDGIVSFMNDSCRFLDDVTIVRIEAPTMTRVKRYSERIKRAGKDSSYYNEEEAREMIRRIYSDNCEEKVIVPTFSFVNENTSDLRDIVKFLEFYYKGIINGEN